MANEITKDFFTEGGLAAITDYGTRTGQPERALQVVLQVAALKALRNCTQASVERSIIEALSLDLSVAPVLQFVYFIPYGRECTIRIGFQGMVEMLGRGGIIVDCGVVHENDSFEYELGDNPYLRHNYPLVGDRGKVAGAYCVWRDMNGQKHVAPPITRKYIDDLLNSGKTGSVWNNSDSERDEMIRKTALRNAMKYIPKSPEVQRAIAIDDAIYHTENPVIKKAVERKAVQADERTILIDKIVDHETQWKDIPADTREAIRSTMGAEFTMTREQLEKATTAYLERFLSIKDDA